MSLHALLYIARVITSELIYIKALFLIILQNLLLPLGHKCDLVLIVLLLGNQVYFSVEKKLDIRP